MIVLLAAAKRAWLAQSVKVIAIIPDKCNFI
jgi:hypothetical protein